MPNILFRADAEKTIGIGDILSLIYLSYEFRRRRWKCFFMARDYAPALAIIKRHGLKNVFLIPRADSISSEIRLIKRVCREKRIDCLFMEITKHTLTQYKGLGRPAHVMACVNFDGIITNNFDTVVNWCVPSDSRLYNGYRANGALFMLGFEKTALPHYLDWQRIKQRKYNIKARNILIAMGGVDEFNLTKKAVSIFIQKGCPYKVKIIIGPGYRHKDDLFKMCAASRAHITIKENAENLFEDYMWADIAFSAGGLTSSELVAAKTPAVLIAAYPHQRMRCKYFSKKGLSYYCGYRTGCGRQALRLGFLKVARNIGFYSDRLRRFNFRGGNEEIFKGINSYRQSRQLV